MADSSSAAACTDKSRDSNRETLGELNASQHLELNESLSASDKAIVEAAAVETLASQGGNKEAMASKPVMLSVNGCASRRTRRMSTFYGSNLPSSEAIDTGAPSEGPLIMPISDEGANSSKSAAVIEATTVFRPIATKQGNVQGSVSEGGTTTETRSRLQPASASVHWPTCTNTGVETRPAKRHRVDAPGYVPNFLPGCGAITGMPLYSGRAKPVPCQMPAPFVQPMWPDPEMLRKLHDEGSVAKPKMTPSLEEHTSLSKVVSQLSATLSGLSAKVDALQESLASLTRDEKMNMSQ